ncbi:MAG TPA: hypothetical protein VF981_05835 [Gemmatimonadaceae bacterium]
MRRLALPRLTFVAAATRLALVVATLLFASDLVAQSAPTLDATDTVRITRRFFGLRYVAGTLPERPVIEPWLGLSLHQSFRDVLGRHPEALEQAQRLRPGCCSASRAFWAWPSAST